MIAAIPLMTPPTIARLFDELFTGEWEGEGEEIETEIEVVDPYEVCTLLFGIEDVPARVVVGVADDRTVDVVLVVDD